MLQCLTFIYFLLYRPLILRRIHGSEHISLFIFLQCSVLGFFWRNMGFQSASLLSQRHLPNTSRAFEISWSIGKKIYNIVTKYYILVPIRKDISMRSAASPTLGPSFGLGFWFGINWIKEADCLLPWHVSRRFKTYFYFSAFFHCFYLHYKGYMCA